MPETGTFKFNEVTRNKERRNYSKGEKADVIFVDMPGKNKPLRFTSREIADHFLEATPRAVERIPDEVKKQKAVDELIAYVDSE
ncbi:MAG: hypothetical protein ABIJ91_03030 [Candidatus Kuenenbacteria bacterium]